MPPGLVPFLASSPQRPPIAGHERDILTLGQGRDPFAPPFQARPLQGLRSGFACALHMHQPTIPAGPSGELISHLQYMFAHPGEGDNHNADAFAHCYGRMASLLRQLIDEGCDPRIMLDYSGNLLWGFQQMGRDDILAALRQMTCDPHLQPHVEWLGSLWSHAVVPSTPMADLKLQMLAWRQHFASLFGVEALRRVRGFSAPEMHLPNHPDSLYAYVKALKDCGYHWLLVQEHSVERLDGAGLSHEQKYLPNQLVARNGQGETEIITALIKTQGSDTKLVGHMQPCYEALGMDKLPLGDHSIPPLVTQIADGENGGVMMNEFPDAFRQAHQRLAQQGGTGTVALNGSEYLEMLAAEGVATGDLPKIQAVHQHKLWRQAGPSPDAKALEAAIETLRAEDPAFSMEGASWTNSISWVEGYGNVLQPMEQLSRRFHQLFDPLLASQPATSQSAAYQEALLHLLLLETSCFRYWGQGLWTDYAAELHRRGLAAINAAASGDTVNSVDTKKYVNHDHSCER